MTIKGIAQQLLEQMQAQVESSKRTNELLEKICSRQESPVAAPDDVKPLYDGSLAGVAAGLDLEELFKPEQPKTGKLSNIDIVRIWLKAYNKADVNRRDTAILAVVKAVRDECAEDLDKANSLVKNLEIAAFEVDESYRAKSEQLSAAINACESQRYTIKLLKDELARALQHVQRIDERTKSTPE